MKLEITKEKVLEAASKCSTAKETLKTLFPEVFKEDDKYFDFSSLPNTLIKHDKVMILIADGFAPSGLERKCFYLAQGCNWELRDGNILIPTKK